MMIIKNSGCLVHQRNAIVKTQNASNYIVNVTSQMFFVINFADVLNVSIIFQMKYKFFLLFLFTYRIREISPSNQL